jgi:hypothetical protein
MKRFLPGSPLAGFLAGVGYLALALVSRSFYPGAYAPATHWLSDLGDVRQNPQGAVFYNLGILLTACLLLVFFLGMSRWMLENHRIQNLMVRVTQVFGVLGCLSMGMSAVYPIDHLPQHRIFSITLYILLGTGFGFSVAALRYLPRVPRWVLGMGILTALADMASGFFHEATWLEWVTVALFLGYVFVVSLVTLPKKLALSFTANRH